MLSKKKNPPLRAKNDSHGRISSPVSSPQPPPRDHSIDQAHALIQSASRNELTVVSAITDGNGQRPSVASIRLESSIRYLPQKIQFQDFDHMTWLRPADWLDNERQCWGATYHMRKPIASTFWLWWRRRFVELFKFQIDKKKVSSHASHKLVTGRIECEEESIASKNEQRLR